MNIKKVLFLGLSLIIAHNSCAMETPADKQPQNSCAMLKDFETVVDPKTLLLIISQEKFAQFYKDMDSSTIKTLATMDDHIADISKALAVITTLVDVDSELTKGLTDIISSSKEKELQAIAIQKAKVASGFPRLVADLQEKRAAMINKRMVDIQNCLMVQTLIRDDFYTTILNIIVANGLSSSMKDVSQDAYQKLLKLNKKIEEYNTFLMQPTKRPSMEDAKIAQFIASYEATDKELTTKLADFDKASAAQEADQDRGLDMEIVKKLTNITNAFDPAAFAASDPDRAKLLAALTPQQRSAFLQKFKDSVIQQKADELQKLKDDYIKKRKIEKIKSQLFILKTRREFYQLTWKKTLEYGLPLSLRALNQEVCQKIVDTNKKIAEYRNLLKLSEGPKNTESSTENPETDYLKTLLKRHNQEREARRTNSPDTMRISDNNNATTTAGRPQRPELLQQINAGNFALKKATPAKKTDSLLDSLQDSFKKMRPHISPSKAEESDDEN